MKTLIAIGVLLLPMVANAGVAKVSFKASKYAGKKAVHYSVKGAKVAKKVLF